MVVVTDITAPEGVLQPRRRKRRVHLVRHRQRAPDRAAGIVGRRLHEDVPEQAAVPELADHAAVLPDAAGDREVLVPGQRLVVAQDVEHQVLERFLHRGGDVLVQLRERFAAHARLQDVVEAEHALVVDHVVAARQQRVERPEDVAEPRRIAVRGKTHHLVFVVDPVPEEADHPRVVVAQAEMLRLGTQHAQVLPAAVEHHRGHALADAVHREHEALIEAAQREAADRVRHVMAHEAEPLGFGTIPEIAFEDVL